ncbi:MAG: tRNA ((6)-L-threonylcarbamoyladenosine(37)-C(2))-methylthiotransferase MtaB [Verrucomicrobiota bacterium]
MVTVVEDSGLRRRAVVHTLGCRLNQGESQMLKDRLTAAGYEVVPFGESAEVGIINTCTVTREADGKCRKAIRQFVRQNPRALVAVVGCYSQMGAAEVAAIPGVDLIIGNQDKFAVLEHLDMKKADSPVIIRERISGDDFKMTFVGDLPFDKRANIKVQDGCDFMCSFCIIPFARGRARSRDWANTMEEAWAAAARGVRELVLTGVNIGTYSNSGNGLVDLVDAMDAIPGLVRLRISSIEPTTVDTRLLDRMADPAHKLLPFLHLPLQSGSDKVLRLMRRQYSAEDYEAFVRESTERVPDLCLGTDIMVGFTGETEEDFAETCDFFERLPFAYTHVFPFSEREGTLVMRRSEGWVKIAERQRRCAVLTRLSAGKRLAQMRAYVGREAMILLEDPREGGFPGYAENYIRVRVEDPGFDIRNRRARVRLDSIQGDWMSGTLLELLDG